MPRKRSVSTADRQLELFNLNEFTAVIKKGGYSKTKRGTPKSKRKRGKRVLSSAQKWAKSTFSTDWYGELRPGKYQAVGCGCSIEVVNPTKTIPSPCRLHPNMDGAQFDIPIIQKIKGDQAAWSREKYYSLPLAKPFPPEILSILAKYAIPWEDTGLPLRLYKGIGRFTFDYSCGCLFRATSVTVKGKGNGPARTERNRVYWFARRERSCEKPECMYQHLPLNPQLWRVVKNAEKNLF